MKLLEGKVRNHEIEVCHMSSRFKRIMNLFRRFMKLVELLANIGRKVRKLAWKLHHEFEFALL
jgi:hypothetical protein